MVGDGAWNGVWKEDLTSSGVNLSQSEYENNGQIRAQVDGLFKFKDFIEKLKII